MNKSNKFSAEVRECAVRMVQEHRGEYPSQWAAIESIAPKIGCTSQTLLGWVKREEVCVFHTKLDSDFAPSWTGISREGGHGFHGKLDSDFTRSWTVAA